MSESNSINPQQSSELSLNQPILSIESPEMSLESQEEDKEQLLASLDSSDEENSVEDSDISDIKHKKTENTEFVSENIQESEIVSENDPETETNWFDLAFKLKKQNQELIQTVVSLEQALAQARHDIQEQQRLSRKTAELFPEEANLNPSRQDNTIQKALERESLTEEIKELQQQIAQLERECAILKEECQDKTHQLTTAERHIRELHSRLQRQQRYALQYKAALEEKLGKTLDDSWEMLPDTASRRVPIQPWSGQKVPSTQSPSTDNESNEQNLTVSAEIPPRSPSFRVNLSKVANQYGSPKPTKSRSNEEIIDLPSFLRRRPS